MGAEHRLRGAEHLEIGAEQIASTAAGSGHRGVEGLRETLQKETNPIERDQIWEEAATLKSFWLQKEYRPRGRKW
jgi:hypothetical protein